MCDRKGIVDVEPKVFLEFFQSSKRHFAHFYTSAELHDVYVSHKIVAK